MVNSPKDYLAVTILFIINLLNYVDRETVAGVLTDVQAYYNVDDTLAGLIQTVFLVFFVIASPLCGYLGDRYNRKWLICGGMTIWVAAVVGSSCIPSNMFWLFLLLRGIVGVGEASYSNVSPSMICDMFTGQIRNRIYMIYYLAVPCGSGLGYVVGSNISSLTHHWQWGVRVTAIAGIIGILILAFFIPEPEKGASDKLEEKEVVIEPLEPSTIWQDLYSISTNVTFINCTVAYTSLVFVAGTMLWWTPTAAEHRLAWKKNYTSAHELPVKDKDHINMLFGMITLASGIIGVVSGTFLSWILQEGKLGLKRFKTDRAPPIICALGASLALPLLFVIILINNDNSAATLWILSFFTITFLCFNWGLNVDIVMSVVVPWRRSTAFSWFMLSSHLLGDGPGPYIVGAISDAIRTDDTPEAHYKSLLAAFCSLLGLLVVSSVMYAVTALTLLQDKQKVAEEIVKNTKVQ